MTDQLPKNLSSFIWHFLKHYKIAAVTYISLAACAGLWGTFNNILVKHVINSLPLVETGNASLLVLPAVLIVLNFIVFDNITWRSIGYMDYIYQPVITNRIITQTTDFVLSNSHQYFQDNLAGRISHQIIRLADNIEKILHQISRDLIRGGAVLIIAFITSYSVNPVFFYILLLWFIGFSSFSLYMSKRLVQLANDHATQEAALSGQLVDCISNQSNIRLFAKKDYELSRMQTFLVLIKNAFQTKELFTIFLYSIQGLMIALMMASALYFLIDLHLKNLITPGDFALILGLSMEVAHMTWYTMSRVDEFNDAVGKCRQCLSSLLIKPTLIDKPDASELSVTEGKIVFNSVSFHYKDVDTIFNNQSITIEPGQKVGLVGYSGSGKSTFVNLIMRLYEVTEGSILIDNQDIGNVTQDSLHSAIGIIPQDPSLFHRNITENIRYARPEATDEQVINAAKQAYAHDFIIKTPKSYDALVGERGIKLSGGQRQRIAIARAILKDAPILILDEATSQLDSITENSIQESLWNLMKNKTTLVIAHRLSTLLNMDRILVFDRGNIVQDGTHSQLLEQNGLYKTLWNMQVCGSLPDKTEE